MIGKETSSGRTRTGRGSRGQAGPDLPLQTAHKPSALFAEGIDLLLGLVFCIAVALLQLARQFLALSFDDVDVIVGQLAPLLLHFAFDLFPVPLHSVPVH